MSRTIRVQAQADHIESLSKAAPLSAVEELVWNALDADAREVKVDLITNALGAVEAVRVSDDGTGIDVLSADNTFGSLGGSWKRTAAETASSRRRLHGRHGRGRFKAFALGGHVEWRTTTRSGGNLTSYVISGDIENPGIFNLEVELHQGPATGTEVFVTNVRANCDSLLNAVETVQSLAARFALYLKSYPDVRIYFNGLPVTPVIVQKKTSDYRITIENGAEAKLEIIEWRQRFVGSGRIVFSGPDGFELHEQPAGVRSGGASFTAYLISPRFPQLSAENALVMDELNPEVRMYLDGAKKVIKSHFIALGDALAAGRKSGWAEEGSYPFDPADSSDAAKRFDKLANELADRMESFSELAPSERGIVFNLLKRAMESVKRGGLKEFLK
jgi:hypothetical protein